MRKIRQESKGSIYAKIVGKFDFGHGMARREPKKASAQPDFSGLGR